MKKTLCFLLISCLIFSICGCGKKKNISPETAMEEIQKKLGEMEGYECSASMKRISNKGENTYEIKQAYQKTGEYRIELLSPDTVAGNYTIFDGKDVYQYNPRLTEKIMQKVPVSNQRNQLFLGEFMKNYMQSEGVAVETAAMNDSRCTVLEAIIPGNIKNLASEKLWIDNETLTPLCFTIYDNNGKERYIIEYTDFTYNPKFSDNLFTIPSE